MQHGCRAKPLLKPCAQVGKELKTNSTNPVVNLTAKSALNQTK